MLKSLLLATALVVPLGARAADLSLVLAIDVSGSVDGERYALQRDGLAAALRSPGVRDALRQQDVEIAVVEWSQEAKLVIPFTVVHAGEVDALAARVAHLERTVDASFTYLGTALNFALDLLAGTASPRKVIDVSGDGAANGGDDTETARGRADAAGVQVNGLPILESDESVAAFYQDSVVNPTGFVVPARGFGDFARAMVQKLTLEIM